MDRGAWWVIVHRVTKSWDTSEETWHACKLFDLNFSEPIYSLVKWEISLYYISHQVVED